MKSTLSIFFPDIRFNIKDANLFLKIEIEKVVWLPEINNFPQTFITPRLYLFFRQIKQNFQLLPHILNRFPKYITLVIDRICLNKAKQIFIILVNST